MRRSVNTIPGLVILAVFLAVLAGCTARPAATTKSPSNPAGEETPTATGRVATALPATVANEVDVSLKEYQITMPTSIPAGKTMFKVSNAGTERHGFVVEGQGMKAELERRLQPGESLTLEVDLAPGTYKVYCPVDGHAGEGMELDLNVTGS